MVYDQVRDILYITSAARFCDINWVADSFQTPFSLAAACMGSRYLADGNTLMSPIPSANTNVWVHLINLNTGQTNRVNFQRPSMKSGESLAVCSCLGGDGAAFITSRFAGSGWVPLRRYDPVSGLTTTIASPRTDSMVSASGDGTTDLSC